MSKYTTEVRFICESNAGLLESTGYSKIDDVITSALPKIFDFDFPIFDEKYRSVLETKILKHYYTREIGEETVGLWKFRLNTRLNEIMPYYNKLYKSELLDFNPLYDVDITRERTVKNDGTKSDTGETTGTSSDSRNMSGNSSGTGKTTGTTTGTETGTTGGTQKVTTNGTEDVTNSNSGTNTNTKLELSSDTPQGSIDNIEDGDYLTHIKKTTDNGSDSNTGTSKRENEGTTDTTNSGTSSLESSGTNNSESESTATYTDTATSTGETTGTSKLNSVLTNTEDYLEHVSGKQSGTSYAKMLQEYRQTFLNIDMSVIMELKDLFMNLW